MLLVFGSKGKIFRKKRKYFHLEALGDVIEMIAIVDFEDVRNAVGVQDSIENRDVGCNRLVFVAGVKGQSLEAPKICDVLVDFDDRSVGGPFLRDVRLPFSVLPRQIKIQRRVLGIWGPRS